MIPSRKYMEMKQNKHRKVEKISLNKFLYYRSNNILNIVKRYRCTDKQKDALLGLFKLKDMRYFY